MTPPIIPGYRLLRFLGGGSLFQVWEGRAVDDVIPVVIKLPRPEAESSRHTLTLLQREIRAGTKVRHPRLAHVFSSQTAQTPHYIVMEYFPGVPLRQRVKQSGKLRVRQAAWAIRQAAEGLVAIHKAGFVHADVKTGNILINRVGETRLIDLGFAHKPGENRQFLKSGYVMGTANYIAPELCRKPPIEGPAADVFSLGVTLFECLTGRLPYPATTTDEALRKRRSAVPLDLAEIPGRWPSRVLMLVRAMLAIDPRSRPTAARVVRELVQIEIESIRRAAAAA